MPVYTIGAKIAVCSLSEPKFSESPLTICPECGKKTLRKVYTPVGIVFKALAFTPRITARHRRAAASRLSPRKQTPAT